MIAIFDLETERMASDAAPDGRPIGWSLERRSLMGISWGVAWCSDGHFRHYDRQNLPALGRLLEEAALVVSYNGISFDVPLLSGVLERPLEIRRHCDLLALVQRSSGGKWKLDEMARANLPGGKSGWGGHAPQLYRDGRLADLATYCERDVAITRDLFFLATARGYLRSPSGGHITTPAQWVQAREEAAA